MRSLILAAALVALSMPASGQQKCAPRDMALTGFAAKFQEHPVMHGITSQGRVVELLVSDDGSTWTLLVTLPGGITCMAAEGRDWQMEPFSPAVPGNPA